MALTKNLSQLRTLVKIAAGMNSTGTSVDLTDTVLNGMVNDAVYEGWDVITQKWLDYHTVSVPLYVTAGTTAYALPSAFYKFRLLEHSDQRRLRPIALEARRRFYGQSGEPSRYMLINGQVHVFPTPSVAETLTLWHIPIKAEMVSDADFITFEVPIDLKYIIAIAWRDVLDRQNLDPSPAVAKMQTYEAKLRSAADSVDATEPFYLNPNGPGDDEDDWNEVIT